MSWATFLAQKPPLPAMTVEVPSIRRYPSWETLEDSDVPDAEPPSYTRRPAAGCSTVLVNRKFKEFHYELPKAKGRPGALLTINGDSRLSKQLPSVMEGDKLTGSVQISLNGGEDIRAVSITARGRVITGRNADSLCTFMSIPITLWSPEMGRLEAFRTSEDSLVKEYKMPFTISLPKEVGLSSQGGRTKSFPLPHTFMEPQTPARVYYELVVNVKQSRWKRNQKLRATFGYFQSSQSFVRDGQLAHDVGSTEEGSEDPVWKSLDSVDIVGTLYGQREVKLRCTLSLGYPLCYTRGSSIPVRFDIESEDSQALDLLSAPEGVIVNLQRCIRYKDVQMCGGKSSRWSTVAGAVGSAVWKETPSTDSTKRSLVGKIRLKRRLNPSSTIANMSIEYIVGVFPFRCPGFNPKCNASEIVMSEVVEIRTDLSCCPEVDDLDSSSSH